MVQSAKSISRGEETLRFFEEAMVVSFTKAEKTIGFAKSLKTTSFVFPLEDVSFSREDTDG